MSWLGFFLENRSAVAAADSRWSSYQKHCLFDQRLITSADDAGGKAISRRLGETKLETLKTRGEMRRVGQQGKKKHRSRGIGLSHACAKPVRICKVETGTSPEMIARYGHPCWFAFFLLFVGHPYCTALIARHPQSLYPPRQCDGDRVGGDGRSCWVND